MDHLDVPRFLGMLVVVLVTAKLLGTLAQRIGQPAVLGELLAGVILGTSVVGLVNPKNDSLHLLGEIGVVLLLFEIGLETDLRKLLAVGGASALVAIVGVVLPFALGYAVCRALGQTNIVSIVAAATLVATSVGITARVLSDLGRLQEPESQIILGAAVIDDVIGLVILAVVEGLAQGDNLSAWAVVRIVGLAVGFLVVALVLGSWLVPPLVRRVHGLALPGGATLTAVVLAFGLGWLATEAGSALIIGAFAAGLLLGRTAQVHDIMESVAPLGHFFVPIFFVTVGASVDVRVFNPFDPASRRVLLLGGLLIVAAVAGKLLAGYAPFWFHGKKSVIGVGMVPRGEVGLIFAQMGLDKKVFDDGLFSAATLMVMVTTFLAPPLLRLLFPPRSLDKPAEAVEGVAELVSKP
jgi:Kef-type K+ transport system membrane component KefB